MDKTTIMASKKNHRLRTAVREEHKPTKRGMLDQMFIWAFSGLVYPQIWEDPEVDMEALGLHPGETSDKHIVAIASGGCNVMSYLSARPASVTAVDLNPAHVALVRLKLSAVQHLPHHESFFRFFGYADEKENVKAFDRFIRPHLDTEALSYWDKNRLFFGRRIRFFARNVYRYGLLGRFIGVVHWYCKLYGKNPSRILSAQSMEEQRKIFDTQLAPLFDTRMVRWLCKMPVSLYGLGIPPAQYEVLAGGNDMSTVLKGRVERLACDFPLTDNYFAWQAFGRRYDTEGRAATPLYLKEEHYDAVKSEALNMQVLHASMTEYLDGQDDESKDGYLLLDAQDWMTPEQMTELWTEITRTAKPGARVVFRTAGEDSPLEESLPGEILDQWDYDPEEGKKMCLRDRSSIYGGFHVYEFKG
jgi:S-adenosylmethionine-diacylglycerol 3-amino-3-carboxypropyl transferase